MDDGVIGYAPPGRGQQTGHLVLAQTPAWSGFFQCDTCNLPREYEHGLAGSGAFRVNQRGEHSCGTCRRFRRCSRGPWYPAALRVFRPPAEDGWKPVRVVPGRAFERACGDYYLSKGHRGAFLLGYAYQAVDGQDGKHGALYGPGSTTTPWSTNATVAPGPLGLARAFNKGRGMAFMLEGGRPADGWPH